MLAAIQGTLTYVGPLYIVVMTGGLGYKIAIPYSSFTCLPSLGSEILLQISVVVRDSAQFLYGFLSAQDRDLFEVLINVNSVGPKLALSLIGHLPLSELQQAVRNHDLVTLGKVPGVGKKTAERLIVELRDRLPTLFPIAHSPSPKSSQEQDVLSALINLGYSLPNAQKALKSTLEKCLPTNDLAILLTEALKHV